MYSENYYEEPLGDAEFSFPRALTVSEINEFIKQIFEGIPQFRDIYIQGEISNFKNHYSTGHFYFTLKDDTSSIKAVMFRSYASRVRFAPENGMKVTVHGRISAFPRDGQYQIYCDSMEPLGIGALYAAFEQLKKKLGDMGLFSESRKKPLPFFPKAVGVVTSATGAAVRDIINVTGRRCPACEIVVYPALVQGEGADETVINGIRYFNETKRADVIIIGRGGGSIEDLWAFNSEKLAYEIAKSEIPIISAVGHETDFTIADFVSDRRAPTPSAAAEIAVPDMYEIIKRIDVLRMRASSALESKICFFEERLKRYSSSRVLKDPMAYIDDRNMQLVSVTERLTRAERFISDDRKKALAFLVGKLDALSPLAVLSRGYSAVFAADGKIIDNSEKVSVGDDVKVRCGKGAFSAVVSDVSGGKND